MSSILPRNIAKKLFIPTLLLVGSLSVFAQNQASFFTEGPEGWKVFDTSGTLFSPQHNSGGYLEFTDVLGSQSFFFSPPARYLGSIRNSDLGATLEFDINVTATDTTSYDAIVLISSNLSLVLPDANPAVNAWTKRTYTFDENSGWRVGNIRSNGTRDATPQELLSVMRNLDAIYIRGEWKTGSDTAFLDNVRFRSVGGVGNIVPSLTFSVAFEVRWNSQPGVNYQVQRADTLDNPTWLDIGSPVAGTGATLSRLVSTQGVAISNFRVAEVP